MTWGEALDAAARRDVEALADAGLLAGARALTASSWLRPIPLIVPYAGALRQLDLDTAALPRRTPAATTSAAIYLLAQHATQARAVALVTGSRLAAERRDAIEVWVEHRDGAALTVLQPFDRVRGRLRLAAPRAYTGSRLIWTTRNG